MISISNEEEIFDLHFCVERISDPDSNITKEMTLKVLNEKCTCAENGKKGHNSVEINNNDDAEEDDAEGAKFIKRLLQGLVKLLLILLFLLLFEFKHVKKGWVNI